MIYCTSLSQDKSFAVLSHQFKQLFPDFRLFFRRYYERVQKVYNVVCSKISIGTTCLRLAEKYSRKRTKCDSITDLFLKDCRMSEAYGTV